MPEECGNIHQHSAHNVGVFLVSGATCWLMTADFSPRLVVAFWDQNSARKIMIALGMVSKIEPIKAIQKSCFW